MGAALGQVPIALQLFWQKQVGNKSVGRHGQPTKFVEVMVSLKYFQE